MVGIEKLRGNLKSVNEDISSMLKKREMVRNNFKELEVHKRDLEFSINCTLANEVFNELVVLFKEMPVDRFKKIQHLMLEMQQLDNNYLKKLASPQNPYEIKFDDAEDTMFIQKLFEKSLNPQGAFNKFMVFLFSQKKWTNMVKG